MTATRRALVLTAVAAVLLGACGCGLWRGGKLEAGEDIDAGLLEGVLAEMAG